MSKIPNWLIVATLGCALILPLLGSYGLWDPVEIQQADVAQAVAAAGSFTDVTVEGKFSPRPVLYVWLVASGIKLFGVNELAGRLPLALCGVLTLLLAYRVGRKLFSSRAGLLSALVLGTAPVFLFQSRQLASEVPYYLALLAAVGGFAGYLWPADGSRSRADLLLGALGLVAGFLAHGLILGTFFPLAGLALAVALSWRVCQGRPAVPLKAGDDGSEGFEVAAPQGDQEDSAAAAAKEAVGPTLGATICAQAKPLLVAIAGAAILIGVLLQVLEVTPTLLWGGEYRRLATPPTFDTLFQKIGFGFFPWFALLPVALGVFAWAQHREQARRSSDAFAKMLVLVLTAGAYVLGAFWLGYMGELRYPALPFLALACGVLLHEVLAAPHRVPRYWGLVAAGLLLSVHQDYFMDPQSLAFSHLLTPTKYPVELNIKLATRVFGVLLALLFFLALGGLPRPINRNFSSSFWGRLARRLSVIPEWLGKGLSLVGGRQGRNVQLAAGGLTLVFAGWCSFYLLPELSLHLSNRALFETYHKCRQPGQSLAQYQVTGRGASYYSDGEIKDLRTQSELFATLRESKRWFVLIPSNNLAAINQAARQAGVTYYVLDDRNSKFLIVSNQLAGKCQEDVNPLKRYVSRTPPKPGKVLEANFENKVKLLGYDVPDEVTRGGKFTITLHFQVLGRLPPGYKIFIHFDQPANRFHGDHEPLDGKLQTQYWLPGDFISDVHDVEIPMITTPSGRYTMYMGFWRGETRLKVTQGPNDGVNRVPLGTLRVRTMPF